MRMFLDLPNQVLGLVHRALCPRAARQLLDDIAQRRRAAGLGVNPLWTDHLTRRELQLILSRACAAVRLAEDGAAVTALARCGGGIDSTPAYFNLLGAVAELRHQWRAARWFYGKAFSMDKHYRPAECNLRRLFELHAFGRTQETVALDDEMEEVWLARLPDRCS